jgi:hypothetical protein
MAQNDFSSPVIEVNFEDRYSRYTLPDTEPVQRCTPAPSAQQELCKPESFPKSITNRELGNMETFPKFQIYATHSEPPGFSQETLSLFSHARLVRMAYHWQLASRVTAERVDYLEAQNSRLARDLKHHRHQNNALHTALARAVKEYRTLKNERDELRAVVSLTLVIDNRPSLPA